MEEQAKRGGVAVGVVRVVVQVSALRANGGQVSAADLAAAGLGGASWLRDNVARAKRAGWLTSALGRLELTGAGRAMVAELHRAWERSRAQLVRYEPVKAYSARPAQRTASA